MATTTNYSWTTPDDTALVKDGAAAIRSLGTAIDTTVFTNAGAAIAKATVDAKGDLIAGTADNTVARLAVGANGTTLVADSSQATGLKWETPASATFSGCNLSNSGTQSVSNNTSTAMTFSVETYDTDAYHSTVTNTSRITIPAGKGGYYLLTAGADFDNNSTGYRAIIILKNNGGTGLETRTPALNGAATLISTTTVINAAVGDYFEAKVFQSSNGALGVGSYQFSATYLGA